MMRPSRAKAKPAIAQLDKLSIQQLEAMLEANNRTLNSSHFASTSTAQPDPITRRLLDNNARIQARLVELRGVHDLSTQLESSTLDHSAPVPPAGQLSPRPDAARRASHLSQAEEDEAVAIARAEERTRRLQDVVDHRADGFSSGGIKILSPHKTEQLEREEAARSPPSQGMTTSASTRDLLRGAGQAGQGAASANGNGQSRGVYDELSHIEKAARMRSFLNYGPSDSDLEWEMEDDDPETASDEDDPDAWLEDDADADSDADHAMASSMASLNGASGRATPAEDDAMMGLERVIQVDLERVGAGGGGGGGHAGGLMPPGRKA